MCYLSISPFGWGIFSPRAEGFTKSNLKTTNKMVRIITVTALTLLTMSLSAYAAGDRPIVPEQLPAAIHQFLKKHFPNTTIRYASVDNDYFDKDYTVRLNDQTKVEFDNNNLWKEIDRGTQAIPAALIPLPIAEHIEKYFDGETIVKIERDRKHFEVQLKRGL